jgi:tRNA A-37 threonylcarbamoyl transferase component Bud32
VVEPLERLLIGRTLVGRYRIDEVIGHGGMSVVYRAEDERLGRPVALKIVRFPREVSDRERDTLRERLRREAAAAARIPPHPNVVQVHDYGTDAELDLDFIVMELLRGSDLRTLLRERRLDRGEAERVVIEAARGIAAGHRVGIVHRDVKPGNIFLVGDDHLEAVKILDLGIAKVLEGGTDEDLTQHGRTPHSPAYASPEQLDPSRPVTPASDVYQLGLVAYEVLSGERPFTEPERERIRGGENLPLPARGRWADQPLPVRGAIERALAPDPADRFPDAAQFARALAGEEQEEQTALLAHSEPEGTETAAPAAALPVPEPPALPAARPAATGDAATASSHGAPNRSLTRPAVAASGLATVALLGWLLLRGGPGGGDAAPPPSALPADVEALREEFRPVVFAAFENLREAASAEEGEKAAVAVQEVIGDLYQTWVHGDLEGHLEHYAERVDFRGARGATQARIRQARDASIERYPEREITITWLAIEFFEPGQARALVDRRWHFAGEEAWQGAARDELVLKKHEDGAWRVVAERQLELFGEDRSDR